MIQFYDDRPADPLEAFVWFENLFRKQFLLNSSAATEPSVDGMREYMLRMLLVKRDLWTGGGQAKKVMTAVIPYWDFWAYTREEFEEKVRSRFKRDFDKDIFRRFERDVLWHVEKLKKGLP